MTTQPEALRLAEWLQSGADDPMWSDHTEMPKSVAAHAADELRRLHEENERLKTQLYDMLGERMKNNMVKTLKTATENWRQQAEGGQE